MENNSAADFSYTFNDIIHEPAYPDLVNSLDPEGALNNFNTSDESVYYSQLGELYRSATEEERLSLINKVSQHIKDISGPKQEYMVNMQLCHWFRTDINLGIAIAKGLDLDLSETMKQMRF